MFFLVLISALPFGGINPLGARGPIDVKKNTQPLMSELCHSVPVWPGCVEDLNAFRLPNLLDTSAAGQ